jgi:hypothetical protein
LSAEEDGESTLGERSLEKPARFRKDDADRLRVKELVPEGVGLRGSVDFNELLGRRRRTLRGG